MPESVNSYVYAYTSGVISKSSTIRVRFNGKLSDKDPSDLLRFSPSIKGISSWEDDNTLLFTPDETWESNTAYVATVALNKLFNNLPKEIQNFEFDFRIKTLNFDVRITGLNNPDPNDLTNQELLGTIYTTDVVPESAVEEILKATQNSKTLATTWSHSANQQEHQFTITGIKREKSAQTIQLSYDGASIGIDRKENTNFEVPALGDFKVTDAKVIQGKETYISLNFSDPLQKYQNLNGLITINDYRGNFKFVVEGNKILVYPNRRLVGTRKITVSPGVKNLSGMRMINASEWDISFESAKPQVRLVGNGVIMPNSEGLIFPFEAVSLNAVEVEIFKIYNNNILQFLQNNPLNGNYQLYTVGRIILQKRVALKSLNANAKPTEWSRYALDLGELVQKDPEAIYQVRIGFRPAYSTYFCSTNEEEEDLTLTTSKLDDNGEYKSIMDGWYGIDGYYEGYNYRHRENPCFPGYYHAENFVQRNVVVSNLGIIAKGGTNDTYTVGVTDLRTAAPIAGATVEFYDFQQQLLQSVKTNDKGFVSTKLNRKPFVAIAKQGNEKGYIRMVDGTSLSLSRYDVSGAVTQKGLKGFLYAERGVWRPGDSIYLNFILEDKTDKLPANYPINFELYDARGQLQKREAVMENVNSVYSLHFNTSPEAPTGNWIAKVMAGGATFNKTIRVETVKPNRLKIDLDFGKETLTSADNPLQGQLQVNWLHGAPASNLKARVEMELRTTNTSFKNFGDYEFDDPSRSFTPNPQIIFDKTLDGKGAANLSADINTENAPGRLKAAFKSRAFESGGDFSTDNFTVDYDPYTVYAGLNIQKNKYGEKRIDVRKPGTISFVTLNEDGSPAPNRKVSIGLYRVTWRWWWDRGRDNISRYNTSNHYNAQEKVNLSSNSKGEVNWDVDVDRWGRYMVRICDDVSGHCSGDFFYAGYPWYDDDSGSQNRDALAMMAFTADKDVYEVGETVTLTIPTGKVGKALVSIENGTEVLESFWFTSKEGENEFSFKTTKAMTPTAYAHVTMLQPHAQVENDLPIRLYGVIPIRVEEEATKLQPVVKMPDVLQPEQTVTVEVSEDKGRAMTYTIAMVDEGLLSLTRFKTPNPWNVFYAREALGVRTWDIYDNVLGAFGGELERILSIGGDAEAINPGDAVQNANRFKPVVRHLGPFKLKRGKKAKHEITLPNYVGAVRTMVVAAEDGAYGSAEKTTPVRKPLMVLATLPRVLSPGEQLKLPVNVFAMEDKVKNVTVSVEESSNLFSVQGAKSQSLQFNTVGDQLASFDLAIAERVGVAKFKITASGAGETASQEIEIQVRNPNPYLSKVYSGTTESGQNWSQSFEPIGMLGTNEAVLEVSNIPPINLGERLDYLIRYPYGCIEQTTSTGFPQLYVGRLLELDDRQKELFPKNISATIERLRQFQTNQGGFAYWPGNNEADDWGSNYAGHFLLEAKALGYSIVPGMLDNWIKFQKKRAKNWKEKTDSYSYYRRNSYELNQAYRLYTLALAKKPDLASMNRMREMANLSLQARWRLAAAYAVAGKPEVAKELINNASYEFEEYRELSYTYGSSLRDRAMALETLSLIGDKTRAAELVKYLSDQLSNNRWYGTQTVAYCLLAVGKYIGDSKVGEKFSFSYTFDGKTVNAGSQSPIFQVEVPVDISNTREVAFKNTSNSILFTRLILSGQPLAGKETAASSDLEIAVSYQDMQGATIDPSSIPQGTDFIAVVKVKHPGTRLIRFEEMALNHIFPVGWEITNTRMDNIQGYTQNSRFDYQDIRDDRVNTFFDINENKIHTYQVQLNAAYQGRYYMPAVSCAAMYDESIYAHTAGQWVEVVAPE